MAWKQSKKDKKNAAKAAKRESPWEELQPSTEFFQQKDALGIAAAAGPLSLSAATVQKGDSGITTMSYRTFEDKHLEHAKTPQEEPLAFILHGEAVQFKSKFPQIPAGRFEDLDWPGKDPKTGLDILKSGTILQMGKGKITLLEGRADFRLDRETTVEMCAEWDERYSPELRKLMEGKDAANAAGAVLKKKIFGWDTAIKKVYAVRPVKPQGKELPKGKRVMQAIFRIPANKSGLDPDVVVPGGGLAARSGKEGIMLRMVSREGRANDDGTEPVWLPDGVSLVGGRVRRGGR